MHIPTAVVTGAASGIGRALATQLIATGTQVMLADIDDQAVHQLADQLQARATTVDVARPAEMEALADAAGDASLVCLNAGIVGPSTGPPWTVPPAEWERVFAVNVGGVINGLRAFVPRLRQANAERHLLVTASLAGVLTFPTGGAYAASKHAVVAIVEQAAMELRDTAVTVTVICPALVRTAMSPIGADPDDVAEAALRAVAQGSFAQIPVELARRIAEPRLPPRPGRAALSTRTRVTRARSAPAIPSVVKTSVELIYTRCRLGHEQVARTTQRPLLFWPRSDLVLAREADRTPNAVTNSSRGSFLPALGNSRPHVSPVHAQNAARRQPPRRQTGGP
jgi:NAD(P)-dependent dehydrogenase (short-subunit alcohol dehydrogenase family)